MLNFKHVRNTSLYLSLLLTSITIQLWGCFTCVLNSSNEYIYLVNYLISPISAFFASYFIYNITSSCVNTVDDFFKFILYTVLLESLLTVLIFVIPPLYDFFDSIGLLLLDEEIKENPFARFSRFNGIGEAVYFGVLPSCALGVMSGLYLQLKDKVSIRYLICVIIISIISFFVTRYSAIVVVVCFIIFLRYLLKISKIKFLKYLILASTLFVLLVVVAINFLPDSILRWAVGAFESDSQHNSTGIVVNWLISTKFDLKTFIVGDACYTNKGGGYYGGVDIGLYRQIFYGGIIGFSIILYFHKKILKFITRLMPKDRFIRFFTTGLFFSYIVCLFKGDLSMIDLFLFVLVNIATIQSSKLPINK